MMMTGSPGLASTGADTTSQLSGAEKVFGFTAYMTKAFLF